MFLMTPPTLIIIPGLDDSGPTHWQTLWQRQYGAARVRQDDPDTPEVASWAARLQEVVEATPGDLVLVAHSCGVPTVVHWAALYPVPARIRGALLVSPPDTEQASMPQLAPAVLGLHPVPTTPLPFAALVVSSQNDPYCAPERAQLFAQQWQAEFVSVGQAGHINVASGHGPWPEGKVLLSEVINTWFHTGPNPVTQPELLDTIGSSTAS